ncbi:cysteine desulfurase family protein [Clostridium cavendishii DSM 21758]|uniref:cysteine desulfurase n=1 Tax=Clostridium cavendishii DSM 21758 TaxID=1121302 RepID=A0A1M6TJT6_9CLOT|nr:aminotransferase class V-fold PLP-dependent enzyme [Clostridium cavendishii]SHK57235.1 cysteine desulfurase family protein [Clostridium cavendishii DSM 21758]
MNIYFDNAATSFPKPQEVVSAINQTLTCFGGNSGRGFSSFTMDSNRIIYNCRHKLCDFFNFNIEENVIFSNNITTALNILLLSIVKPDWHIISTSMEHNSVLRPLFKLREDLNIDLSIVNADSTGLISIDKIKSKIQDNTKLIILSHSSNLVGTIQPIKELGQICKDKDIFLILDTAQTAGVIDIDMKDLNVSALAFTGHKSLLGPQGIGGFLISDDLERISKPVLVGGTGSDSHSTITPNFMPDKFECGTLNTPGISGLSAGIDFISKEGLNTIREKEEFLCDEAMKVLLDFDKIKLYGPTNVALKTSTIAFNIDGFDASQIGFYLDKEFNIVTRTGLHCAPLAHKTIGTFPNGTVRISLGYFNTVSEIKYFKECINKIIKLKNPSLF